MRSVIYKFFFPLIVILFATLKNVCSQSWNTTGNAILNTQFIGVLNGEDLIFKTTQFSFPPGSEMERMRITQDGKFGFGISSPQGLWSASGVLHYASPFPEIRISNSGDSSSVSVFSTDGNNYLHSNRSFNMLLDSGKTFSIARRNNNLVFEESDAAPLLKLTADGMLYVKALKVTLDTFPDFVFHPAYTLMPLNELKEYIKTEQHLPGIPSGAHVMRNGLDVGASQAALLQKIEELTLYIISLKEELDMLKQKINEEK